jgi:hypothetical protein
LTAEEKVFKSHYLNLSMFWERTLTYFLTKRKNHNRWFKHLMTEYTGKQFDGITKSVGKRVILSFRVTTFVLRTVTHDKFQITSLFKIFYFILFYFILFYFSCLPSITVTWLRQNWRVKYDETSVLDVCLL